MPFSKYISLIQLICAIVSILLITSLVIGVTRVGFYGAAAMAFSICKNREFYFAISGNPILQFPVKLVYNKQHHGRQNLDYKQACQRRNVFDRIAGLKLTQSPV